MNALVISTIDSVVSAKRIAEKLVEEKLAACVNIIPGVLSFYRWEDSVQDDNELILLIKTTAEARSRMMERLKELHTYDVPEAISVDIAEGLPEYMKWIGESVVK